MSDNFVVVATDGEDRLMARREDVKAGNYDGDAYIEMDGQKPDAIRYRPLQTFFKFGTWELIPLENIK